MSFPRAWARLPGPADFLHTILEDLTERTAVLAGLPDQISSSTFTVEIADLVKYRRLGRWDAVRSAEARAQAPADVLNRRLDGANTAGSVLWIDATADDEAATAWADHVRQCCDSPDMPRFCVAMSGATAEACDEDKRLRRRLWRDFVTPLDARALVERFGRRSGHRPAHIALRSALIAELAGTDLTVAEQLLREPLGRMLETGNHPRERVWAAQVSVLFPVLERERLSMLNSHRRFLRLPHTREDGTQIRCLSKLEIGDLAAQARLGGPLETERQRLGWLRRVRNALAHNEVVPWATLTSPIAVQIADFRQ